MSTVDDIFVSPTRRREGIKTWLEGSELLVAKR